MWHLHPRIPFLYEQAFQWYDSFDALGDLLAHPNPTPALELLLKIVRHLVDDCGWHPGRVHLFGFAQGGSVAAEFGLRWWRTELERTKITSVDAPDKEPRALASVVSVCGPLLSYPTLDRRCPTPVLVAHRPPPSESALPPNALAAFRKGYNAVTDVNIGPGEGMPRSKNEWEPIMRFWSERLQRGEMEGLYEVMGGAAPA
jgi:pimeloyl-ACP methyl ester carboxylesterase